MYCNWLTVTGVQHYNVIICIGIDWKLIVWQEWHKDVYRMRWTA